MQNQVIEKFINQFKAKHPDDKIKITGVLGFGSSFNRKKLNLNSDLDIYLIIKNIGKRYRGIMFVNNIEVDYFVNPIEQLKLDWEKVKNKTVIKKTVAYMLKDGKIILDQNNELRILQEEVMNFLENELKSSEMSSSTIVISKYFIDDYLKDIEDSMADNNIFSWQYNIDMLANYLIEIFCQYHKIPLVKPKYQRIEIVKKDRKFIELYESISKSLSREEGTQKTKDLALYVLESLGGKLPKEWELESPVVYKKDD